MALNYCNQKKLFRNEMTRHVRQNEHSSTNQSVYMFRSILSTLKLEWKMFSCLSDVDGRTLNKTYFGVLRSWEVKTWEIRKVEVQGDFLDILQRLCREYFCATLKYCKLLAWRCKKIEDSGDLLRT